MHSQHAQGGCGLHGPSQLLAVHFCELKESPFKVHSTVLNSEVHGCVCVGGRGMGCVCVNAVKSHLSILSKRHISHSVIFEHPQQLSAVQSYVLVDKSCTQHEVRLGAGRRERKENITVLRLRGGLGLVTYPYTSCSSSRHFKLLKMTPESRWSLQGRRGASSLGNSKYKQENELKLRQREYSLPVSLLCLLGWVEFFSGRRQQLFDV